MFGLVETGRRFLRVGGDELEVPTVPGQGLDARLGRDRGFVPNLARLHHPGVEERRIARKLA